MLQEASVMIWGIPADTFLQIHVVLSLIGLVAGIIVVLGLANGQLFRGWTALALAALILTDVTGFPLPPFGFDPARKVAVISLVLLAIAVAALYVFRLGHAWRWIFVVTFAAAVYLDAFVGVVQAFGKLAFLEPLQGGPAFIAAQVAVLAVFVVLAIVGVRRFHPAKG
jgi:hypothetical protein